MRAESTPTLLTDRRSANYFLECRLRPLPVSPAKWFCDPDRRPPRGPTREYMDEQHTVDELPDRGGRHAGLYQG